MALRQFQLFESETQAKKNAVQAIKDVARRLGNTPAVCRKCYVHPWVLECYMTGSLAPARKKIQVVSDEEPPDTSEARLQPYEEEALRSEERALMQLLRSRAEAAEQRASA
jgi:DNA topoisomerase I